MSSVRGGIKVETQFHEWARSSWLYARCFFVRRIACYIALGENTDSVLCSISQLLPHWCWEKSVLRALGGEVRDPAQHPTVPRTPPQQRTAYPSNCQYCPVWDIFVRTWNPSVDLNTHIFECVLGINQSTQWVDYFLLVLDSLVIFPDTCSPLEKLHSSFSWPEGTVGAPRGAGKWESHTTLLSLDA
jgi:hypothetical protein